ncbi:hypothetical protein TUM19329_22430 [Legionella antarctica]|uniref:Uncharacterized protein n=1 Tax=Legionella antarctica TaxID=2708020 RepID=A0A6F8T776_9GAMM|nr:hypothetical protein [Legionella antarctica]BCA95882.1 hypothetical protein TUM19329_22430 [Legionella antarctica]
MTFDDKNNIIEVCVFESYLAKYFLEHPEIFQPLINKILEAIDHVITSNSDSSMFNRLLFSVFSQLREECPGIENMSALKESKSLVAFDTFCKYFNESVMSLPSVKLPETDHKNPIKIASLSSLAQYSLFTSQKHGEAILLEKMRPSYLFSDRNRGVTEIDCSHNEEETRNLGILSSQDTPEDLTSFFLSPHFPSRQYYKPQENSVMALCGYSCPS